MRIADRLFCTARTDGFVILLGALALAIAVVLAAGPGQWFGPVVTCLGGSTIRPDGVVECTGGVGQYLVNMETPVPQPYGPR
jgi:hypothetical protein